MVLQFCVKKRPPHFAETFTGSNPQKQSLSLINAIHYIHIRVIRAIRVIRVKLFLVYFCFPISGFALQYISIRIK